MRIINSETWRTDFTLREPYTIAYETYDSATNLFVRLETDTGLCGYGCAAPAPEVTGESIDDCKAALEALSADATGIDPTLGGELDLGTAAATTPAAAAAVDMAVLDLRARAADVPLCVTLGGAPGSLITSVTLGIESLEATLERGRDQVAKGFRALKVKGGRDVDADIARICGLRDHGAASQMFVVGPNVNGGLVGEHPSLSDLGDGDLKFHTDFRSVYATLLENWLEIPAEPVLGAAFPKMAFV